MKTEHCDWVVGIPYVKEMIEEEKHERKGMLWGIISERWKQEKCQKVGRTVNGNTGPACTVISTDTHCFRKPQLPPATRTRRPLCSHRANRRHQSHWLRNHSLPISPLLWRQLLKLVSQICSSVCSASKDIYLHIVTTTHTHIETNTQKMCPSLCQDQKVLLLNFSLSCFLYPSLYVLGCWIYADRIHLMSPMFSELNVFMWALKAHYHHIPEF